MVVLMSFGTSCCTQWGVIQKKGGAPFGGSESVRFLYKPNVTPYSTQLNL